MEPSSTAVIHSQDDLILILSPLILTSHFSSMSNCSQTLISRLGSSRLSVILGDYLVRRGEGMFSITYLKQVWAIAHSILQYECGCWALRQSFPFCLSCFSVEKAECKPWATRSQHIITKKGFSRDTSISQQGVEVNTCRTHFRKGDSLALAMRLALSDNSRGMAPRCAAPQTQSIGSQKLDTLIHFFHESLLFKHSMPEWAVSKP